MEASLSILTLRHLEQRLQEERVTLLGEYLVIETPRVHICRFPGRSLVKDHWHIQSPPRFNRRASISLRLTDRNGAPSLSTHFKHVECTLSSWCSRISCKVTIILSCLQYQDLFSRMRRNFALNSLSTFVGIKYHSFIFFHNSMNGSSTRRITDIKSS